MTVYFANAEERSQLCSQVARLVQELGTALRERDEARAEVERLRAQVAALTTCDCGRPLSPGKCGICDNDE